MSPRRRADTNTALFETVAGGGVHLRHPQWADYDAWAELRLSSRQHLQPWEPRWSDDHLTRSAYRARLTRFKKMVAADQGYPFHIFRASDNVMVGAVNLTNVQRKVKQSCALGYWIAQRHSRQGYARAAVRAVSRFAFETLALHRIEAAVGLDNTASRHLLDAAGFTHEGIGRGYLKIDGVWRDHDLMAKLSND
ncbi:GNAT family N-acetyltransferase [Robiginitomaculum antarcticum]|uniref:GNAT family N-acetyltransferase n=1 Tax=Robiginitomaculum antarcticum TaxID=437507 RepID=UPI00037244A8|nr:GNAT family protein [Robiginitomaculum antarcticum]